MADKYVIVGARFPRPMGWETQSLQISSVYKLFLVGVEYGNSTYGLVMP